VDGVVQCCLLVRFSSSKLMLYQSFVNQVGILMVNLFAVLGIK
jgi:hypothetical protein